MSEFLEGNGLGWAINVYDADPVLRLGGIAPPDPPAEPLDAREREYFVRVCDALLAMRPKVHGELREAWSALRGEFLADSPFGSRPPSAKKTMAEIEALALIVRVSCCRCGHPIWAGYHAELRMALMHSLAPKARAMGLADWEDCVADLMVGLFDVRLGVKDVLNPEDPDGSRRAAGAGTPRFWRYNPAYYFTSWLNRVAVRFMIDASQKPSNRPGRNLPLDDGLMDVIPMDGSVEEEALVGASKNPERDGLLFGLSRELNSLGLHPKFIEANIRALVKRQQKSLETAESPGEAERIRAGTQAKRLALEELNAGWQNHTQVIDGANARIESELGRGYGIKRYDEQKLFWGCADQFILHCVEACGADVSLLDIYLKRLRPKDRDCPRDPEVRRRMEPLLKAL